ncbi:aldo/keto reductase [Vibrio kasasachensis]|uniref:aldo/keto reductase n=1 Tax=Vibrio kasasachensis TaxID=2910248 RepID=UPI003D0D3D88
MQKRILGKSDLDISVLGLGSWAIGGNIGDWGWGEQSIQDSINTIHAALDNGINWIDTAPAYGLGNSERVIAKALKQSSHRPYIFTKCGFRWNEGESELLSDLSSDSIREEIELSLARLNVDCIDLYQIHKPNQDHLLEQAWETLSRLKKEGKVRHIGVSNFSVAQLERVNSITPITSLQPPYSLINREIEQDVLPWCLNNQVGTIHHSAMSHGLLTGTWDHHRLHHLDAQDWRRKSAQFQEPAFSQRIKFVDFLKELADKKQCTVAQLSIAWTLAHPATTGTIIGARTSLQLKELLPAAEVILSSDELKQIDNFRHS